MVLKCNRIGFENDDVGPDVSKFGAEFNAKEFETLYEEEKKKTDTVRCARQVVGHEKAPGNRNSQNHIKTPTTFTFLKVSEIRRSTQLNALKLYS